MGLDRLSLPNGGDNMQLNDVIAECEDELFLSAQSHSEISASSDDDELPWIP